MANQTTSGLTLPCPYCGESEAEINLHLWDGAFTCTACDSEFTREDVRGIIEAWLPVLAWVDTMPSKQV